MRALPAILTALCLLAPATPARATVKLTVRAVSVRARDTETVEWSGLPAWVQEVELELSLDGGRWVRVSPELEVREGAFHWRVPAIASSSARLRLRAGGEHREVVLAESEEFAITSGASEASAGEDWWQLGRRSAEPAGVTAAGPSFAPLLPASALLVQSRTSVPVPSEHVGMTTAAPVAPSRSDEPPPALPVPSRSYPLRN